ncbi:hypothetical protein JNK62_03775 [bacterium]|nr:hypothetical protein [bacterium]
MSNKGLGNLTPREVSTILLALAKAGASEEERKIFFNPYLCDTRIATWIKAIRENNIAVIAGVKDEDITLNMRCTD